MKTTLELIDDLVKHGGAIVSSGECHELEIATAQACGRFAVREDGMGFLRRPKEWLENPSQSDKEEIAKTQRELELEDLLASAREIARRQGEGTAWERFDNKLAAAGISAFTAKTFRILPSDSEQPV